MRALQIFGGIFRCYAVVFSLFVGVLETEWGFVIKFWKVPLSFPLPQSLDSECERLRICCSVVFGNDGIIELEPN
jgi:hypothetical protein